MSRRRGQTLKRVCVEGSDVWLVPENEAYDEKIVPAERVRPQGEIVMVRSSVNF